MTCSRDARHLPNHGLRHAILPSRRGDLLVQDPASPTARPLAHEAFPSGAHLTPWRSAVPPGCTFATQTPPLHSDKSNPIGCAVDRAGKKASHHQRPDQTADGFTFHLELTQGRSGLLRHEHRLQPFLANCPGGHSADKRSSDNPPDARRSIHSQEM